ncbi:hypothetical protein C8R45DRAFT_1083417 [Mycena sanguinolenta]|nr:hypothetical protein C8R45DRAFT_1083417 [Mycena sanguinolenta]
MTRIKRLVALLFFPLIYTAASTSSARSLSSISGSGLRNLVSCWSSFIWPASNLQDNLPQAAGHVPTSRVASSPPALNLVLKASKLQPTSHATVKIICAHARVVIMVFEIIKTRDDGAEGNEGITFWQAGAAGTSGARRARRKTFS